MVTATAAKAAERLLAGRFRRGGRTAVSPAGGRRRGAAARGPAGSRARLPSRGRAATEENFAAAADAELADARPRRQNGFKIPLARNVLVATLRELSEAR